MTVTLRQLRYALTLDKEGHFGRAAEQCHVTQPALSQQIRQLEAFAGSPLFDRLGKSVRATPFGREFLEHARRVIEATNDLTAFTQAHTGQPARPLRFGLIPTVAPYLLPDLLPALGREIADIEFNITESRTDDLLAALATGEIDLALIATDPPVNGVKLTIEPLFNDPFVLAVSRDRPVSEPVKLGDLPRGDILLLDEGHCFRDQAIEACAMQNDPRARTFAATSLPTIVEFVASGQGITLLPAISLRKEGTDPRIRICELAAPGAGRMLSLVWRQTSPYASLFRRIAEQVRQAGLGRLSESLPRAEDAVPGSPAQSAR